MHYIAIILLSILSAVIYGILHDQITARICIEYFTIGHPPIFNTESPTLIALGWGTIGTWWVGMMLGVPLAFVARFGKLKKLQINELFKPILTLLGTMGCVALFAGVIGYLTSSANVFYLVEPFASKIPENKHVAFLTAGWMHSASYLTGFIGGIVTLIFVYKKRKKLSSESYSKIDN